jgi:heterotetrameric sarcosine oxidase gamma subunit
MKLDPLSSLGAPFDSSAGVPGFVAKGASLRERADIGCVLVTAAINADEVLARARKAVEIHLPTAAGAIQTEGRRALWLSPRSWLVLSTVAEERNLCDAIDAAFPDQLLYAAPFTDALCWLEVTGAQSLALLSQMAFVSLERGGLPVSHAKRTLLAGIPVIVIHERECSWLIGVERSRARYVTDCLIASVRDCTTIPS